MYLGGWDAQNDLLTFRTNYYQGETPMYDRNFIEETVMDAEVEFAEICEDLADIIVEDNDWN